jgi:hypothetical protein
VLDLVVDLKHGHALDQVVDQLLHVLLQILLVAFLKQHRRQQTLVLQDNRGLVSIIKEHHHVRLPQEVLCGVDGLKPADHALRIAFLMQRKLVLQHLVLQGNQALSQNKEHHHVQPLQEVLYGVVGLKQADHV